MFPCRLPLLLLLIGSLSATSGCSYRFTNLHLSAPAGAKTLAIEAIYDTSRVVIPHDILWTMLQTEFATDGHLVVTSQSKADLYLRVHLQKVEKKPIDLESMKAREPDSFTKPDGSPHPISDFPDLRRADTHAKQEQLSLAFLVEVWDLRRNTMIFNKDYNVSDQYRTYTPATDNAFLQVEETMSAVITKLSRDVAKRIVVDFLRHNQF